MAHNRGIAFSIRLHSRGSRSLSIRWHSDATLSLESSREPDTLTVGFLAQEQHPLFGRSTESKISLFSVRHA
jgi:hypothetical protein